MKKIAIKSLSILLLVLMSSSIVAQSSRWSIGAGTGAGYYANIGVWGLKYNNSVDYALSNKISVSGTLGFYQSLVDFQGGQGVSNTLSLMHLDGNLNYCLFKTIRSNSLWIGVGLSYFRGAELMENQYSTATKSEETNINTMGFNMKLKYKHKLSDRLSGSINLESYSMDSFFDPDNLLINVGYSVAYHF